MATIKERVNNAVKAISTMFGKSGTPEIEENLTTVGRRFDSSTNQLMRAFDIFGLAPDYLTGVMDCKKLSEANPIFSGIMDKVVGPVSDAETYVKVDKVDGSEDHPMRDKLEKDLNKMISSVEWNSYKDENLRNLLNEGGLTMELIADKTGIVRGLEYRPHYSIEPLTMNGRFLNPEEAYYQFDVLTKEEIATFAKWQIAEVNWKESAFHSRGVPYLLASRKMLSGVGDMLSGAVQKWMRSGGEIEVFALKEAKDWKDVAMFKDNNAADLTPNSKSLVRQIYSKGDLTIDRLHGDQAADSTTVIEFILELIFLSTGVSKEVMGFKGNLVIKDMASLSVDSYYRLMNRLQAKAHSVLRRACDIQVLLQVKKYGVLPENVEYELVGGSFQSDTTQTKIDTTIKVIEQLNKLMSVVENKQVVLEQIIGVLTYDLKDYGISFKEELKYAEPPDQMAPGQRVMTKNQRREK
ncbi:MAG: hypothetical protein V1799_07760 [bacterium]